MSRNDDLLNIALKTEQAGCRKDDTQCRGKCKKPTYEELEAQVKQLAAERDAVNADNVYLRDQVICWARECDRITFTYTNKVTDAHQREAEQELANTLAATDACAASLRAEGVEMLAKQCEGYATNHVYSFTQRHALEFAAQLRSKSEVQS